MTAPQNFQQPQGGSAQEGRDVAVARGDVETGDGRQSLRRRHHEACRPQKGEQL
mgnify:CR=1 FL=1